MSCAATNRLWLIASLDAAAQRVKRAMTTPPGEPRYEALSLLDGALAAIECRVEEIIERHSHALVIGEPTHIEIDPSFGALIYWRARYSAARALPRFVAE